MDGTKQLNRTGGANRFRFSNFAERIALVDVDVARSGRAEHEARALPDAVRPATRRPSRPTRPPATRSLRTPPYITRL